MYASIAARVYMMCALKACSVYVIAHVVADGVCNIQL